MLLLKHNKQLFETIRLETLTSSKFSSTTTLKQQPKTQLDLVNLIRKKKNIQSNTNQSIPTSSLSSSKKSKFKNIKIKQINQLDYKKHLLKEEDKIKLIKPINSSNNNNNSDSFHKDIIQNEKAYLNRASFDLHTTKLDSNESKYLNLIPSLAKTSIDPKHLTILHTSLATKLAAEIQTNQTEQKSNLFVDLNPGAGLISESLINNLPTKNNKYLLIESFNKFMPLLSSLKQKYSYKQIHLVHDNPFGEKFLYKSQLKQKIDDLINSENETNLIVYGILPWNSKGYLSRIYSDYVSNRGWFQFKSTPTLYLIVPELVLAKMNPNLDKIYSSFNSSLTVMSHLFSKCNIISQETSDLFYPYPQVSQPYKYNKYPLSKLDLKKLYFIRIKFNYDEKTIMKSHKRLLYLLLTQMFTRPSDCVKNSILKHLCKNVEHVCKQTGLNQYLSVKKLQPYQFYILFNYLITNSDQLVNNLSLDILLNSNTDNRLRSDESSMNSIRFLNKNYSGQFRLPSTMMNETKTIKNENEFKFINKSNKILDDLDLRNDFDLDLHDDNEDEFEFDLKRNQNLT